MSNNSTFLYSTFFLRLHSLLSPWPENYASAAQLLYRHVLVFSPSRDFAIFRIYSCPNSIVFLIFNNFHRCGRVICRDWWPSSERRRSRPAPGSGSSLTLSRARTTARSRASATFTVRPGKECSSDRRISSWTGEGGRCTGGWIKKMIFLIQSRGRALAEANLEITISNAVIIGKLRLSTESSMLALVTAFIFRDTTTLWFAIIRVGAHSKILNQRIWGFTFHIIRADLKFLYCSLLKHAIMVALKTNMIIISNL